MDGIDPVEEPGQRASASEPARSRGPLVATLIGCGALLLPLAQPMDPVAEDFGGRLAYALGLSAVSAIIVGLVVYLAVLRRASTGWKVGSLATIALAAILVSLVRAGGGLVETGGDTRAVKDQMRRAGQDPGTGLAAGAETGPHSRMTEAVMNAVGKDSRAFEQQLKAAGFEEVAMAKGLTPASRSLTQCQNFDALAAQAGTIGGRLPAHLAMGLAVGRSAGLSEAQLRDFEAETASSDYPEVWRVNAQLMSKVGEMCRFLASHEWENRDGQLLFLNAEDLEQFNHISESMRVLITRQQDRAAEASANLQRG